MVGALPAALDGNASAGLDPGPASASGCAIASGALEFAKAASVALALALTPLAVVAERVGRVSVKSPDVQWPNTTCVTCNSAHVLVPQPIVPVVPVGCGHIGHGCKCESMIAKTAVHAPLPRWIAAKYSRVEGRCATHHGKAVGQWKSFGPLHVGAPAATPPHTLQASAQ